ncbi:hypothetical protein [Duncaniella freteri]|uniref:hypothetical protein n=1 Tax=Duncaniella freteri TaxID=2530391 RepID=UPI0025735CAF|nr:hypothetical protein [Duncaniella freteri]
MLLSLAIATAIYFILYFVLFPHMGNDGLWIAFLSYLLSRGIILHLASKRASRDIFLE